ncbi:MAG: hypothetical protein JWL86_41 [Rhizobium sp.]|nr:hypothetical protein [Rhizobium sp.]
MYVNRQSDIAFIETIEAPTIIDGLAFGTIGSYKYCMSPNKLLRFSEAIQGIFCDFQDAQTVERTPCKILPFQLDY